MDKVSHPLVSNESLVCDILSRLPVKSLMRFKCVCKPWQSLIKNDRYFIDLHFTRSNTAPTSISILIGGRANHLERNREMSLLSTELLLPSDGEDCRHEGGRGGGVAIQRKIPGTSASTYRLLNGLICYIDRDDIKLHRVCVHNPSTGESTPWVTSLVRQQFGEDYVTTVVDANGCPIHNISSVVSCEFGYDPATKEHKVVGLWSIAKWDMDDAIISEESICEVWTVGSNSWRRIDDHPRPGFVSTGFKSANYANGSIYWLGYTGTGCAESCLVEFNVGSEKFREIFLPNYIRDDVLIGCDTKLIQLDGHLAILALAISFPARRDNHFFWTHKNKESIKTCILYDINNDQDAMSASSASNYYWIEGTFLMPPFDPETGTVSIQPIPGTDLFVVRSYESNDLSLSYYNWKKKSFSSSKFEIHGILEQTRNYKVPLTLSEVVIYTFRESILPVNPS